MKNTVSKKILTGALLTAFALSNSTVPVLAFARPGYLKNINESLISQNVEGLRGFNSSSVLPDVYSSGVTSGLDASSSAVKPTERIKLRGATSLTEKKIPVTLSLRDSDLQQVLRMFADKAGLNIIFDNDVRGSVTLDLVDVPINDAFELIMELNGLFYFIDDNNTLVIYSGDAKTAINMKELIAIPVKYVDALAMSSFLNKNIFGLKKPGLSGVMVATTNPRKNEVLIFGTENDAEMARRVIEQFDTKPESRTYRVNHVTPDAMADMICTQLLPTIIDADAVNKKSSSGHITGAAASKASGITIGGGQLACGYTSSQKVKSSGKGKSVIDFESLPLVAMEVAYSPGLGTINVVGATPQQFAMIEEFIKRNDKKEPQAYLEISIIELSEEGQRTFDNAWGFFSKNFTAAFTKGSGNVVDPLYLIDHGHYREAGQGLKPGEHVRGGLVWVINYLVDNKKGRVVANPRILITNSEESTIDLTSDYVKTVTSQVVQGTQQATSQKDYEIGDDNGIKVEITPFISPDGYVTLDINPDYATIKDREYATNDHGEQELVATLLQRRNLELKKVRIKDGETLIIGGMLREEETKNISKIPLLGDLPYIGAVFRSTSTVKSKEEMIIMITPKIITDNEDSVSEQETL